MAANYKDLYTLLKIRYLIAKGAMLGLDKAWVLKLIEADKLDLEKDEILP